MRTWCNSLKTVAERMTYGMTKTPWSFPSKPPDWLPSTVRRYQSHHRHVEMRTEKLTMFHCSTLCWLSQTEATNFTPSLSPKCASLKTRELLSRMTKVVRWLLNLWHYLVICHLNSPWLLLKPQPSIIAVQPLHFNNEAKPCSRAAWKFLATAAGSFLKSSCPECKKNH